MNIEKWAQVEAKEMTYNHVERSWVERGILHLAERLQSPEVIEAGAIELNNANAPLLGQTPGVDFEPWELEHVKRIITAMLDTVTKEQSNGNN